VHEHTGHPSDVRLTHSALQLSGNGGHPFKFVDACAEDDVIDVEFEV